MRQPIVVVLGHVDHGKTKILDFIRKTQVQKKEAGGITQHIGATEVPDQYIRKFCNPVLEKMGICVDVKGLLFVDTPGHAAFSNLRRRGGSVADMAVLVIDVMSGIQPQTIESMEILKNFRVPFIVAVNKIDLLPEYKSRPGSFFDNMRKQTPEGSTNLEVKIYGIISRLNELGFEAERIDRVEDFTKQVAVAPTSGETGEGVVDILALLAGLAKKYLERRLETTGITRGNILEIKQEKGLGATADVIIYDGILREGDTIVFSGSEGPVVTKVRALLKPMPLKEIRAEKKFSRVKEAEAATGIKISAPDIGRAVAGSSILVATEDNMEDVIAEVQKELKEVEFSTDDVGVVVKADALGTLEALVKMLHDKGIKVRMARVGDVARSDIVEAEEVKLCEPFLGVVLGFNVRNCEEALAADKRIKVITGEIVYKILEEYEGWVEEEKTKIRERELAKLPRPAKFQIIPGYTFRASKPAIVGVEVLGGLLKNNVDVMNGKGEVLGDIKQLEVQGKSIKEAGPGSKMAASIYGPTVGRQIKEGDILFTSIPEADYKKLVKFLDLLGDDEKEALNEIVGIKRQERKTWGMLTA